MIKYKLRCEADHCFDAWFPDSAAFDKQAEAGFLSCPTCGSTQIAKALMAPNVSSSKKRDASVEPGTAPQEVAAITPEMEALRSKLHALRTQIESKCDYVGQNFAEEARKIHYGETDPHGIYGEASASDAESLKEEGITFAQVPWLPKGDA